VVVVDIHGGNKMKTAAIQIQPTTIERTRSQPFAADGSSNNGLFLVQFFHDRDSSGRRITYTSWWNRSTRIVSLTIIGVTQQHYNEPFVAPRTPLLSEREVIATDSVAGGLSEDRSSFLNEDVDTSSSVGVVENRDDSSLSSAEIVDNDLLDVYASNARSAGIDVVEHRKRYGNYNALEPAPDDAQTTGQPRPFADLCYFWDPKKFDPYSPACLREENRGKS
jgi:hypothetical protein